MTDLLRLRRLERIENVLKEDHPETYEKVMKRVDEASPPPVHRIKDGMRKVLNKVTKRKSRPRPTAQEQHAVANENVMTQESARDDHDEHNGATTAQVDTVVFTEEPSSNPQDITSFSAAEIEQVMSTEGPGSNKDLFDKFEAEQAERARRRTLYGN